MARLVNNVMTLNLIFALIPLQPLQTQCLSYRCNLSVSVFFNLIWFHSPHVGKCALSVIFNTIFQTTKPSAATEGEDTLDKIRIGLSLVGADKIRWAVAWGEWELTRA